jgi:hypothetical protein
MIAPLDTETSCTNDNADVPPLSNDKLLDELRPNELALVTDSTLFETSETLLDPTVVAASETAAIDRPLAAQLDKAALELSEILDEAVKLNVP